jgi:hypothetical protein
MGVINVQRWALPNLRFDLNRLKPKTICNFSKAWVWLFRLRGSGWIGDDRDLVLRMRNDYGFDRISSTLVGV